MAEASAERSPPQGGDPADDEADAHRGEDAEHVPAQVGVERNRQGAREAGKIGGEDCDVLLLLMTSCW
jgi:hypothetical protein